MLFSALFRALSGTVEWIQDEDRHPRTARLSRRAFARLVGAVVLFESARPSVAYGAAFGECSGCNGHRCPEGCMIRTGRCPAVGNVGPNCWCEGYTDEEFIVCDCDCEKKLCECSDKTSNNPCRRGRGGRHPGELF